jgi:peptidyl-prolyl cis-trans isomerase SurA
MSKMVPLLVMAIFLSTAGSKAQTLFTYGTNAVSKQAFLKAFKKNNTEKSPSGKAYRNYLELYIRFKLKVQAAYDMKIDTMTSQKTELQNFRGQVADGYINDNESMNKLVIESFTRSQKDIHLSHIFIAFPKNATEADSLKAQQKAMDAYGELSKGKNFAVVAEQYSDDASVKQNHGDIGYITVFTLPYELENLAYTTPAGKFSRVYRSKTGLHIFKNLGERKALGKISAAQILLAFPPNASDSVKAAIKQKADSIYNLAKHGAGFGELAKKFSDDNLTFQTNGEIAPFGVGKFDRTFEDAAFSLKNDGDISAPVLTGFGYHIIKRLGRTPVPATADKATMDLMRQRVLADPRVNISKKILLQRILSESGFKSAGIDQNELWIVTDSALHNKPVNPRNAINNKTVLFSFAKKDILVSDWISHLRGLRNTVVPNGGTNNKTYKELYDQFLQTAAFEYYRNHLEDYNKDFAFQLNEFKEGNMLFEIMQREVWAKASADSAGLKKYFEANKNKYWWDPSADAIVFTSATENAATAVKQKLQTSIAGWRKLMDASNGSSQADSGRFLLTQLPIPEQNKFTDGQFTSFTSNQPDNTVTFAYIVTVHNERSPRNFTEARGLVTNDYQLYLEDKWIEELKGKYPVKINEEVFKSLK